MSDYEIGVVDYLKGNHDDRLVVFLIFALQTYAIARAINSATLAFPLNLHYLIRYWYWRCGS